MSKNFNNPAFCTLLTVSLLLPGSGYAAPEAASRVIAGPDIGQIILALGFVVFLVLALAFLSKFVQAMRYSAGQNIKIVEALALNNRDKLMIVEVNQQQLLVGLTANGMQTLHVLDEPVSASDTADSSFSSRLFTAMQGQKNA